MAVLCAAMVMLGLRGAAFAEDGAVAVSSHSLRQVDTTLAEINREQRQRDLFLITPEEGLGYFEEQEREHQRRRLVGHYRKVALRRLRSWSLAIVPGEWSDEPHPAEVEGATPGDDSWLARTFDQVVNRTDVELGYGAGNGLSVTFGRDIDWHGPAWLESSRVEVDPMGREVVLDFDLHRTSIACSVGPGGEATVSWTIPF